MKQICCRHVVFPPRPPPLCPRAKQCGPCAIDGERRKQEQQQSQQQSQLICPRPPTKTGPRADWPVARERLGGRLSVVRPTPNAQRPAPGLRCVRCALCAVFALLASASCSCSCFVLFCGVFVCLACSAARTMLCLPHRLALSGCVSAGGRCLPAPVSALCLFSVDPEVYF